MATKLERSKPGSRGAAGNAADGRVEGEIPTAAPHRLVMRDLMDLQLVTADDREIGRVDDVEAEIGPDGYPVLAAILCGPEALAGRVSPRLIPLARRIFRGRFKGRIPLDEVADFGLTIRLKRNAREYPVGQSDVWIGEHVLRHIPGADR